LGSVRRHVIGVLREDRALADVRHHITSPADIIAWFPAANTVDAWHHRDAVGEIFACTALRTFGAMIAATINVRFVAVPETVEATGAKLSCRVAIIKHSALAVHRALDTASLAVANLATILVAQRPLRDRLQGGLAVQACTDLTIGGRRSVCLVDTGQDMPGPITLRGLAVACDLRRGRACGVRMEDAGLVFASPGPAKLPEGAVFDGDAVHASPLPVTHTRGARGASGYGGLLAVTGFAGPGRTRIRDAACGWIRALDAVRCFAGGLVVVEAEGESTSDDRAGEEKGQRDPDGAHALT